LGAAVAAGAPQVGQHHSTLAFAQRAVGKALEHPADVFVALVVTIARRAREIDLLGCV
jgi:hypothetical protein